MEMGHSPQRLESLAANCVGKNQAGVEESAELDRGRVNNGQTERTYHQGPLRGWSSLDRGSTQDKSLWKRTNRQEKPRF